MSHDDHLNAPIPPRDVANKPYSIEIVQAIRHWTDSYFSFTTTRDDGLRFDNGQFVMIGLMVEGRPLLRAYSIGPRMIAYLEEIGIERLADLKGADAEVLAMRIDVALGRRHMNRLGVEALRNLIALANREA